VVNGKVLFSERIKEASRTIKELKKKGAKVVILAHQGRKGKSDFTSLKLHLKFLNKYVKVKFVKDIVGKKAVSEIKKLKSGEALLLENVRGIEDEFEIGKKNNKLIKILVPLADIYVNDAFSVCHRKHTSIVGFARHLPSCAGRLFEEELNALKRIVAPVKIKKTLFILGGAKPEDNILLLKGNKVLATGFFGQLCLIAKGKDFGAQNKYLKDKFCILPRLKRKLKMVKTPVDFAVNVNGKRTELGLSDFPSKYIIDDIGEKTMKEYEKEIKNAKGIFMKGPAGFCADKKFCKGTTTLLKAIAKSNAFSLIGGGHLNDAIKKSKIPKKSFGHVSLSGGALIKYVSGEKLPGIEVLNKNKK